LNTKPRARIFRLASHANSTENAMSEARRTFLSALPGSRPGLSKARASELSRMRSRTAVSKWRWEMTRAAARRGRDAGPKRQRL
jgi:hypothetical protein